MSAPQITVRQAVAAFHTARIEAARVAGHPVPRCAVPTALRRESVAPDGSTAAFFWVEQGRLIHAKIGEETRCASSVCVANAVTRPGTVAVAVDASTPRAMRSALSRHPLDPTSEMGQRIRHATRIVPYAASATIPPG